MQQLAARLQKEVEERAWVRAVYTLQLVRRFRCWRCRWWAARKSFGALLSQSIKQLAWDKRAWWPSCEAGIARCLAEEFLLLG